MLGSWGVGAELERPLQAPRPCAACGRLRLCHSGRWGLTSQCMVERALMLQPVRSVGADGGCSRLDVSWSAEAETVQRLPRFEALYWIVPLSQASVTSGSACTVDTKVDVPDPLASMNRPVESSPLTVQS